MAQGAVTHGDPTSLQQQLGELASKTSIFVMVLFMKAEGISGFVYTVRFLFVHESTCKEMNNSFTNVVWRNKHHHLKKKVFSVTRVEGGFQLLDFVDMKNAFKIKWLKKRHNISRDFILFYSS